MSSLVTSEITCNYGLNFYLKIPLPSLNNECILCGGNDSFKTAHFTLSACLLFIFIRLHLLWTPCYCTFILTMHYATGMNIEEYLTIYVYNYDCNPVMLFLPVHLLMVIQYSSLNLRMIFVQSVMQAYAENNLSSPNQNQSHDLLNTSLDALAPIYQHTQHHVSSIFNQFLI